MKILVVCHYGLYKNISNSFVHKQVKEYVHLGHAAEVIIPLAFGKLGPNGKRFFPLYEKQIVDGVELHYLRYFSFSKYGEGGINLFFAKKSLGFFLRKICKSGKPEIIHAHTIEFDGALANWIKEKLHIPVVITTHGSDTHIPMQRDNGKRLKEVCDEADEVVAVSRKLANSLKKCGTNTKISEIYNGYSTEHVIENVKKYPFSIIQVGNLTKQKNFSTTIEAFSILSKEYSQSVLTLIGDGEERKNLKEQVMELGLAEKVRFLGNKNNKEVLWEMAQNEVFVLPSINEGFGIVYLEAMASGCITIGPEMEAIAEVIKDRENGLLLKERSAKEIADAIRNIWNNPDEKKRISEKAICSMMNFTWKSNAQKYLDKFKEIVERNNI